MLIYFYAMQKRQTLKIKDEERKMEDIERTGVTEEPETAEEITAADETAAATEENAATEKKSPFAGMKEQKGLKAKVKFFFDVLEKYPDVRQMVLFVLFSFLCGLGQLATTYILKYALETVPALNNGFFQKGLIGGVYLFNFPSTAEFIGFLCGATVGQVLTFILNRKKTFRATNNVVIAAIMYAIIAVLITLLQTLIGGWVTAGCQNAAAANGTDTSGIVGFLITLTGLAVGGITALVLSFLGNKFLVMRNWSKKDKRKAEIKSAEEETAEPENK